MTLTYIGNNNMINYICLSEDIREDNTVQGASRIGNILMTLDTKKWYVIQGDLTLAEYNIFTGGVTNEELRLTPLPVSISSIPSTSVTNTGAFPVQESGSQLTLIGETNEPAASNDSATSGLNGLLKRIAQNLTSIYNNITSLRSQIPSSLGSNGGLKIEGISDGTVIPISGSVITDGLTDTQLRASAVSITGALTDIQLRASSILVNGPITNTELRAFPLSVTGTFYQNTQPISSTQLPTSLGQTTKINSFPVVIPSDQTLPVSGTFWQATQPVSGPLTDTQLRASNVGVNTYYATTGFVITGFSNAVFANLTMAVSSYLSTSVYKFHSIQFYGAGIASILHYAVIIEKTN